MKNLKCNFTMLMVTFIIMTLLPLTTVFATATSLTINPKSIAYSADLDLFAIVGTSNLVLTSKDGTNWAKRVVTGASSNLGSGNHGALAWGNNMFVGTTGTAGKILISDKNASSWRVVSTNNALDQSFTQICYEPTSGYFVAGAGTLANTKLWKSTNALDWTEIAFTSNYNSSIGQGGTFYSIISGESGVVYAWQIRAGGIQRVHKISNISSATPTVIYNQSNSSYGGLNSLSNIYAGGKLYTGDESTTSANKSIKTVTINGNGSFMTVNALNTDTTVDQNFQMGAMASNGNYVLAFPNQNWITTQTGLTTNISVFSAGVSGGTDDVKVKNLLSDTDRANTYITAKYATSNFGPGYAVAAKPNGYFVAVLNSSTNWNNVTSNGYWNILKIDNVNTAATPTYSLGITNQYDDAVGEISIVGNSSITIPSSGNTTSSYTASVVNSSNVVAPSEAVTWSSSNLPTGVSFNTTTGVVTVDSTTAAWGTFSIKATSNSQASVFKTYDISLVPPIKKPVASNASISGIPLVGNTLIGAYLYSYDVVEAGSTYRILASSSATDFSSASVLTTGTCNATTPISYVIDALAKDKYIKLEITPKGSDATVGDIVLSSATLKVQSGTDYNIINDTFEGATGSGTGTITLSDGAFWSANRNVTLSEYGGDGVNTSTFLYGTYGSLTGLSLNRNLPMELSSANGKIAVNLRVKTSSTGGNYYLYLNDSAGATIVKMVVRAGGFYYFGEYVDASTAIVNQQSHFITEADKWYNVKIILNFNTHKADVRVGSSVDDLRLFVNSKSELGFYANGTAGSYTMSNNLSQIQFAAGDSGMTYPTGIDDVRVAFVNTVATPPKSNIATIASEQYQINYTTKEITGVRDGTSIAGFLGALSPATGATTKVYDQTGTKYFLFGNIKDQMKFTIVSEDGTVSNTYVIRTNVSASATSLITPYTITDTPTGKNISTLIKNNNATTHRYYLIAARFNENQKNVGIVHHYLDINAGDTGNLKFDDAMLKSGETMKIFLWDSFSNLIPLTEVLSAISVEQSGKTTICELKDNKKAAYTFTTDDNLYTSVQYYNEDFKRLNLRGSMVMNPGFIQESGASTYGTWDKWRAIIADGHFDVTNHTMNHINPITIFDPAAQSYEINDAQTLLKLKFPGQDVITEGNPNVGNSDLADSIIKQKHYAGRNGAVGYNTLNPSEDDWYRLKWLIVNSVVTPAQMNAWVDTAISNGNWMIELMHGINGQGSGPALGADITAHFEYVASKLDTIWCGTFNEVTKYIREKQHSTIEEKLYTSSEIVFNLTHDLDKQIFTFPLTLKTQVPADWTTVSISQNGVEKSVVSVTENAKQYVYYDAIPNVGDITLLKGN